MCKLTRAELIPLLVEAGNGLDAANQALIKEGHDPLTTEEAIALGLILPDGITADAVLANGGDDAPVEDGGTAKPKPKPKKAKAEKAEEKKAEPCLSQALHPLQHLPPLPPLPKGEYFETPDGGAILQTGPAVATFKGAPVCAAAAFVTGVTAQISAALKAADPDAWATYKSLKEASPGNERERKARAYAWAWARLLQLYYLPNG
jgi:hypothetical protein